MLQLFRTNPGLAIVAALCAGGALVLGLCALAMVRAKASLRPLVWLAGFMGLTLLPQLAGHLYMARTLQHDQAPRAAALARMTAQPERRLDDARRTFGDDVDPALVVDVRASYGDVFAGAESAYFAVLPAGESVLLAGFASAPAAQQAWLRYLRVSGLSALRGEGDSERGYAVTRPTGDRAYALARGPLLGIWTGKDDATLRARMARGGFVVPVNAPLAGGAGVDDGQRARWPSMPLLFALGVPYLCLIVLYYFKGAAWAGTRAAGPGVAPVPALELSARLTGLNTLDLPFRVESGRAPNTLVAQVRYGDAKWLELARARALRRTFRIVLTLDPARHTVRATDYVARFDASAGQGGAELAWQAAVGGVFFHDLSELKAPLIAAVTRAGWRYRPTIWEGPRWLHWLTV